MTPQIKRSGISGETILKYFFAVSAVALSTLIVYALCIPISIQQKVNHFIVRHPLKDSFEIILFLGLGCGTLVLFIVSVMENLYVYEKITFLTLRTSLLICKALGKVLALTCITSGAFALLGKYLGAVFIFE